MQTNYDHVDVDETTTDDLMCALSLDPVANLSSLSLSATTCASARSSLHDLEGELGLELELEADEQEELEAEEHDGVLILLDWDDTLFPTSMINDILHSRDQNDLALVRDDQIECLQELGRLTLSVLTELIARYGADAIHIVTNSLDGWIKVSLNYASCIAKIYGEIEALLLRHRITMQSAQSLYAKRVAQSTPTQWKQFCFDAIFAASQKQYSHVLSIGDQWTDHYAVKQSVALLADEVDKPTHHVIKLKMAPTVNDMINEVLYIKACFAQIFDVISCKKSAFFENPKAVRPVIIDYHDEELKYMQQFYQQQTPPQQPPSPPSQSQSQSPCINIENVNVNLNVNVNVINALPQAYHL